MARTRKKAEVAAAKPGTRMQLKWVRSAICAPVKQKLVVKGLGFTRLNQVIDREDTPSIRGMVAKVPHLVEILDGDEQNHLARHAGSGKSPASK